MYYIVIVSLVTFCAIIIELLASQVQITLSFYQMKGDVGMHNSKNHGNKKSS